MKTNYTPDKLNTALTEIAQKHPLRSSPPEFKSDQRFAKMLKRWAYMSERNVIQEAAIIPARRLRQLVEYINGNILNLPVHNLNIIIKLRATEDVFRRLFSLWTNSFDNADFNSLLNDIIQEYPAFSDAVFKESRLTTPVFLSWIQSNNIPFVVGKTCIRLKNQVPSFKAALQAYMVSPESPLGKACIDNYYTYCAKDAYLRTRDRDLERVLTRYNENQIHDFLQNFLTLLDVQDFLQFYFTGKFLIQKYTGLSDTTKFNKFFISYPTELVVKYQRWLDYITIRDSFRNNQSDPRLIFWSKFVPYTEGTHMEMASRALIMKFEQYVAVEFTEETMGALYIYEKADFERRIRPKTRTLNNTELRSYLKNNSYVERVIHNGNWQGRTERYLKRNRIAK